MPTTIVAAAGQFDGSAERDTPCGHALLEA